MNLRSSSSNPNLLKLRFTKGFLRALMRIYRHRSKSSSSSPREISQRYRRIKLAADASMALAVGSRRLWSRAVLWRIRNQARKSQAFVKRVRSHAIKKRAQKEKKVEDQYHLGYDDQENKLRTLVPGGAAMDIYSLLDETSHYIKCLTTQVKMMRRITEICST